jgi:membrane protein YqaA with SNARE-associated domain
MFVLIFAATILAATSVLLFVPDAWAQEKELLQLLLPAETALLGSAVGFYFGAKDKG